MIPDTTIVIFTYNRPRQFTEVVRALMEDPDSHRCHLLVMDDCSPEEYAAHMVGELWPYSGEAYRAFRNRGKKGFWQMWNEAFRILSGEHFDRFIFMPDDMIPYPGFIGKVIAEWESIQERRPACLSFFYAEQLRGKTNWTGVNPVRIAENLWQTEWVDGAFICGRKTLEALAFKMIPIGVERWAKNPNLGSGVGQQLSVRLKEKGLPMYHLHRNLVQVMDCDSQMNPNIRKQHPLT